MCILVERVPAEVRVRLPLISKIDICAHMQNQHTYLAPETFPFVVVVLTSHVLSENGLPHMVTILYSKGQVAFELFHRILLGIYKYFWYLIALDVWCYTHNVVIRRDSIPTHTTYFCYEMAI